MIELPGQGGFDGVLDGIDSVRLADLNRAWRDWPPLRKAAAAFMGHKPKPPPSRNYAELLRLFPDCVRK